MIRERIESGKSAPRTDPLKSKKHKEIRMKKYIKPSLKGLGLLRVVTKFSRVCVGTTTCAD
jgi:hypothetical protein